MDFSERIDIILNWTDWISIPAKRRGLSQVERNRGRCQMQYSFSKTRKKQICDLSSKHIKGSKERYLLRQDKTSKFSG